MDFDIIQGTPEHSSILTDITHASKRHWNYPEEWMTLWHSVLTIFPEYISENEVWMAVEHGKPIAYYSLKYDGNDLWLDNLWVLPEHMGQGIGKELFQHALERSRARDATVLKIEADPNAQSFYEKMGAHKVREQRGEVDGQPRVLPVLEIAL